MRDDLTLFIVLWAIYIAECFVLVPNRALLFSLVFQRPPHRPGTGIGNAHWRLAPLVPLPLNHLVTVAGQSPLAFSPSGISSRPVQNWAVRPTGNEGGQFLPYEDAQSLTQESGKLLLRGKKFADCGTEEQARKLLDQINTLHQLPEEQRGLEIKSYYESRFPSKGEIDTRIQHLAEKTRLQRRLSSLAMAYSLVLFPLAYFLYPSPVLLLGFLLSSVVFGWVLTARFFFLHKALFPEERGKRLQGILKQALCFPVAIGSGKDFSLHAFPNADPLAIGRSTLADPEFLQLARTVWLDLQHPLSEKGDPAVPFARNAVKETTRGYLEAAGVPLTDLEKAPQPLDPSTICYCPRCFAEFTQSRETCSECPGVPVLGTQAH